MNNLREQLLKVTVGPAKNRKQRRAINAILTSYEKTIQEEKKWKEDSGRRWK